MIEPEPRPALPGEPCPVAPHDSWSELEAWVWREVGSGRIAGINQRLGKTTNPKKPGDWGPDRRLSPRFLETILLHDPWRSAIPRQGVHIKGALFDEPIDLKGAKVSKPLLLDECCFLKCLDMTASSLKSLLSLDGSIGKSVELSGAACQGPVFMRDSRFQKLRLTATRIEGQCNLRRAVTNELLMESIRVSGDLFIDNPDKHTRDQGFFEHISLIGARICGQAKFTGAIITCLNMDSISISGSLLLDEIVVSEIDLNQARIGGQVTFVKAMVNEGINLGSAVVRKSVFMRHGNFKGEIIASFAKVSENLDLRDASLSNLNLAGAQIGGELRLSGGGLAASWHQDARLILCNANVGVIQDDPNVWPETLECEGFTYGRFGGLGAAAEAAIAARGSEWFKSWLAKVEPYSPQPYHQCAKVLREMGHPDMANDVLYVGRERERGKFWQRSKLGWFGLSLLKWTTGYGYGSRYFRSLWWILGFVIVGTMMSLCLGVPRKLASPIDWATAGGIEAFTYLIALAFFSLDLLLPIIQLHEPHYQIVLDGAAKYYFAFHKLMGYVLASFLIAGLAGLTK